MCKKKRKLKKKDVYYRACKKKKKGTHWAGFEPARAEPIGFRVQRLNHSATSAAQPFWLQILPLSSPHFPQVNTETNTQKPVVRLEFPKKVTESEAKGKDGDQATAASTSKSKKGKDKKSKKKSYLFYSRVNSMQMVLAL